MKADRYPTPEEQRRFFEAYIQHQPFQSQPLSPATTTTSPRTGGRSSISSFMLDSRAPPSQINEDEKRRDEAKEAEFERLMRETRLWRIANSAFWIAWGIVQAKIPAINEAPDGSVHHNGRITDEFISHAAQQDRNPLDSDPMTTDIAQEAPDKQFERLTEEPLAEGLPSPTEDDGDEEFDYLGYAQERAMFLWGDVLQLGIVKKEELPPDLLDKIKIVSY